MATKRTDYSFSNEPEPHKARTRAILKQHPEVKKLFGRNPWSFLIILSITGAQIFLAWFVGVNQEWPWWGILLLAWGFGAFANHALFTMIHEASHHLIFKKKELNIISGILADMPQVLPASVSFKRYHMIHHAWQGDYHLDADIPSRWEAKLIGSSALGKAIWLFFFPAFQILRTPRMNISFASPWVIANWALVFGFNFFVIWFWGPMAFLYLFASLWFSVGFHPVGARWIQEHFLIHGDQETYSYYGPLNKVAFNIGHHNEHHDFPAIPWHNLPKLRRMAPEYYNEIHYYTSWTGLLFKFLFTKDYNLYSRMLRESKGGVNKDRSRKRSKKRVVAGG